MKLIEVKHSIGDKVYVPQWSICNDNRENISSYFAEFKALAREIDSIHVFKDNSTRYYVENTLGNGYDFFFEEDIFTDEKAAKNKAKEKLIDTLKNRLDDYDSDDFIEALKLKTAEALEKLTKE